MNLLSPYLAIGKLVALLGALALICWQSSQIHRWHTHSDDCATARKLDHQSYESAVNQAQLDNAAHVATENKLREQINEASRTGFNADRDRLRSQSGAAKGSAGPANLPEVPHAAPGTPPAVVSLPPAELLHAQEIELQLNALIDWVNQQSAVDPNK